MTSSTGSGVFSGSRSRGFDGAPVGLLLRGRPSDRAAAVSAVRLADDRGLERGLVTVLMRPFVSTHAVAQAGFSPERHLLELDLEARCRAVRLLEELGLRTKPSFFNIGRPGVPGAARVAAELGCDTLIVPTRNHSTLRRLYVRYGRRFDLSILLVQEEQGLSGEAASRRK